MMKYKPEIEIVLPEYDIELANAIRDCLKHFEGHGFVIVIKKKD